MASFVLAALVAIATTGESHTVSASTYFRTFSRSHPVLLRIKPGDSVITRTLDSAGLDEKDEKRSEPYNPLTGPFFIEGAEPGDSLVVRIKSLRMNRNWGWSAFRLGLFALTPEDVEHVFSNQDKPDLVIKGRSSLVPWDIDLEKKTVRLREPKSTRLTLEFPARPMLGCIGVAPPGNFAPTSGPSGSYGGNLDYNRIVEGSTVILPVYHPGGLLFVGDGHALQGDGESTGTGIETSMDLEMVVDLKKKAAPAVPRVETEDAIISIGSQPEFASALDNGLKMATSDMVKWLTDDYGLEPWAAHLLIGYQGQYDVVTVAGSMALRIPKSALPGPASEASKSSGATPAPPTRPIAEKTAKLTKIDGFLPIYWDESGGKVWMEVPNIGRELLYQVTLVTGVGSNPIGLDRGQLGDTKVVAFRRAGPKLLLEEPNYRFRALSDNAHERQSVADSFARSVIWGFKIEAEEEGRLLVDATSFFLRDAHGVADRLKLRKQGSYRLDESRSDLDRAGLKSFPKNTEVEATLTFATDDDPGPLVSSIATTPKSVTVRERHSLVELPELGTGYSPRKLDPRVGVFGIEFADFSTPTDNPIETRWISRHRLVKKDPSLAVSEPVKPLIYYVDRAAPEPVRSALVEGASWWSKAFESAGFKDAFRVEVLPEGVDPMDVRYNVIHWVHRSTRGWSYGNSVTDPRTGEILKGTVSLDSQRARQDALIGAGLVPSTSGCGMAVPPTIEYLAHADPSSDLSAMTLARIRQLSAHEVGHTLGFAHNFAASTYERGSVMDYPAPMVKIVEGRLDLSDAYGRGIGSYDEFATRFAYTQFAPGTDESKELNRIVAEGVANGMRFLSDSDARPLGAAHPLANLWDNGPDPVAMLRHEMEVRRIGLATFGTGNIPEGSPLSDLEARLLPLYLHHRYQLQAAVKTVGGVDYSYAVKTASGPNPPRVAEVVPAPRQREALAAVIETLDPRVLAIPPAILGQIPPVAFGQDGGTAERFEKRTGPTFDPIGASTIAADLAVSALLQPERAARLVEFHANNPDNVGFGEVLDALIARTFGPREPDPRVAAIQSAVRFLVVERLMELASDDSATPQVRAQANLALIASIVKKLGGLAGDEDSRVDAQALQMEIARFRNRPDATHQRTEPLTAPPGDPIGSRGR
ncbi:zinc-dependent metalloprotease [Tundrisphaera lichenicola]|uniref:zinc-dependent metalloprotease n=1 Tax=Tundrisphaera lichenicola TaxID=2029860 RepID=UPI003EB78A51